MGYHGRIWQRASKEMAFRGTNKAEIALVEVIIEPLTQACIDQVIQATDMKVTEHTARELGTLHAT